MTRVAVRNASDSNQVRSAELRGRLGRRAEAEELKALLEQPAFRRYVWRQLARCPIFSAQPGTPDVLAFEQGQRSIGVAMLTEVMQADINAFPLMQLEAREKEADSERRSTDDD